MGAYEFGKFAAGTKFVMDCLTEMASTGLYINLFKKHMKKIEYNRYINS